MTNAFYNDFDQESLIPSRVHDHRTVFQRARDRMIHNSAFRRMQAKTQVFLSGEYDFYRTRLTHSIEVAQIAGSICGYLNHASEQLAPDFAIDRDLCEAAALAHDIGHPPFGHAGESTLNRVMRPYGGFEGNAQTLRLITETVFTSGPERRGLNPPRGLIDAVLKYKTCFGEYDVPPANHFVYDQQQRYLDFVCHGRPFPDGLAPGTARNQLRSLECEIMDWADDTAYSLNDLVDGANAGFVTVDRLRGWSRRHTSKLAPAEYQTLTELSEALDDGVIERFMNRQIGASIAACRLIERDNFLADLTNRYRYGLEVDPEARSRQQLFSRIAIDLVFRSPQVCQLEHKGHIMLARLFETLKAVYIDGTEPPLTLLSRDYENEISAPELSAGAKARIICDYLAGMTDGYASRIYKRLFDPDFGSIVDLV